MKRKKIGCNQTERLHPDNKRKGRYKEMTREHFENNTNWKMSYEEYQKCDCTQCDNKDCIHRNAFRRVPVIDGGLGLCPNLKES